MGLQERTEPGRVFGSIALITGASGGVGAALARELNGRGTRVAITGRSERKLTELAATIEEAGGECLAVAGDIRREADVRRVVDETVSRFGRIDVLINNAAVCRYGAVESLSMEDYQEIMDVNVRGAVLASRAVLPVMRAQERGDIFNVASIAGLTGLPNLTFYCGSKFALVGFSQALGREVSRDNIRVSCVCPGWIDTDMIEAFPESVLPPRSEMISPERLAKQIAEWLAAPRETERSPLERRWRRLTRRFARRSIPVFQSM